MRKQFTKAIAVFMMMFALLTFVQAPLAGANPALADGTYTIEFTVLKDQTNQTSTMDGYLQKPAKLEVTNGSKFVSVTLKNSDWIQFFKTEQNGSYVDATVVSTDPAANTRVVKFPVSDLTAKTNVYTHVKITTLPFPYDHKYNVQIQYNTSTIKPQ
ncbi:NEAT domain-containing protein [Paenibacillus ehimensis]|uniref:NEAT domain-containing protein n=1 Tax=Paenibacillus ehimensis TaxID=79264 RepID=A0ABT8VES0_9BACL|nr:NEAT domain-containing protein [Paenibacillus ehimensis]MDO3679472.1 NEAT domain-containing protein [Paenibacillus ehimensis]